MNDFSDLLVSDAVILNAKAANKKALFRLIARRMAKIAGLDADTVEAELHSRERLASTGFVGGIAIPHGRLDGLAKPTGLFLRLAEPIDYGSVDDLPVDCVFALLSPTGSGTAHLRALARISRSLRDEDFLAKLRGARSEDALYALLMHLEAIDAA